MFWPPCKHLDYPTRYLIPSPSPAQAPRNCAHHDLGSQLTNIFGCKYTGMHLTDKTNRYLFKNLTGCPKELQVVGGDGDGEGEGNVVACKSACEAFGLDQYCCAGEFANPTTCRPSFYSSIFKRACPRAYSYAYDDGTSTFTCKADDYAIIFCPMNG